MSIEAYSKWSLNGTLLSFGKALPPLFFNEESLRRRIVFSNIDFNSFVQLDIQRFPIPASPL